MTVRQHVATETFAGAPLEMFARGEVGDASVIAAVVDRDEYRLRGRKLNGAVFDIGAHIGSVSIPLLVDHPDLFAVAVEPVPENREMLDLNARVNCVRDRLIIVAGAVGTSTVEYGWEGRNHFVGGLGDGDPTLSVAVEEFTLGGLLDRYAPAGAALVKLDCEGCEWSALADPAVDRCALIVGEYHDGGHHDGGPRVQAALSATHDVTFNGFCFFAEHR